MSSMHLLQAEHGQDSSVLHDIDMVHELTDKWERNLAHSGRVFQARATHLCGKPKSRTHQEDATVSLMTIDSPIL